MNAIELKQKWVNGEPSPGMWLRLADPTIPDMVSDIGFDWVMFDTEHAALDLQTLQMLIMALSRWSAVPLVRVPFNDHTNIKRVLDIGAAGVLVPHIKTVEDAISAVAACKYPPQGIRGTGPRRPGRYGRLEREYIRSANEQTIVMLMIETVEAVSNIEAILSVSGLDAIITGPVDLATGMGYSGDFEQPQVQAALDSVIQHALSRGVPFGDGRPTDEPATWLDKGARIISIADDEMFIRRGAYAAMEHFEMVAHHPRRELTT